MIVFIRSAAMHRARPRTLGDHLETRHLSGLRLEASANFSFVRYQRVIIWRSAKLPRQSECSSFALGGALVVCASIVQVGHAHAGGQGVQSDCALCHTAHVIVQLPIPQSLPHSVWIVEATVAPLQPIPLSQISVFSLFTRPPPVDFAFACNFA